MVYHLESFIGIVGYLQYLVGYPLEKEAFIAYMMLKVLGNKIWKLFLRSPTDYVGNLQHLVGDLKVVG